MHGRITMDPCLRRGDEALFLIARSNMREDSGQQWAKVGLRRQNAEANIRFADGPKGERMISRVIHLDSAVLSVS